MTKEQKIKVYSEDWFIITEEFSRKISYLAPFKQPIVVWFEIPNIEDDEFSISI